MKDECTHPYGSFKEMCTLCGQRLQAESGVALGYIHEPKNKENLIAMEKYLSFASNCHGCKSLAELKRDENETAGALATVLKFLSKSIICSLMYEIKDNLVDRDVRQML
ncbi:rna polymerase ii c-terminal domain phosphatase-like 4 [Quercus suber]|uniref:Rna polymerase ii c-terminal domain phosphatase-like 4 n=1 Tax=Quercus suber TaxID=58331 RepID=A0AAW0K130_QUESU